MCFNINVGQALNTRCLAPSHGVTSALQIPSEHLHCAAEAPARPSVQSTVLCLPGIHEGWHRKQGGQVTEKNRLRNRKEVVERTGSRDGRKQRGQGDNYLYMPDSREASPTARTYYLCSFSKGLVENKSEQVD